MKKSTYKAAHDRLIAEIDKTKSKRKKASLYSKLNKLELMYLKEYSPL